MICFFNDNIYMFLDQFSQFSHDFIRQDSTKKTHENELEMNFVRKEKIDDHGDWDFRAMFFSSRSPLFNYNDRIASIANTRLY